MIDIILYITGGSASFYLGRRLSWWQWSKRYERDMHKSFNRGYKHGRSFLSRVNEQRLDVDSAVKILDGK